MPPIKEQEDRSRWTRRGVIIKAQQQNKKRK